MTAYRIVTSIIFSVFAVLLLGLSYFAGVFVTSFDTNLCYSQVIERISRRAESSDLKSDARAKKDYESFLKSLPLAGYETDCRAVLKQLKAREETQP